MIPIYYVTNQNELYHHGIKGQKWGVRRFQNPDGTRTSAGKKREASERKANEKSAHKIDGKKIAIAAGVLTVAAATAYVASNPKARQSVVSSLKSFGSVASQKTKAAAEKGKHYMKRSVQEARQGFKEGVREGIHNAPKKFATTVAVGAGMYAGKKALDKVIGPDDAGRIFRANDKKKIGSFWTYKEKDDDEDD